jgi:Fe-S cluster biogenesis protein NfuA/nitrite reductase/ring-hydroxylating ferredoxin subunit
MPRQTELERRIAAVDQLVRSLESGSDPATRAAAQELVGTLLELHAGALERILAAIERSGEAGPAIVEQLARDDMVSGVLLLHDLHPIDRPTRVLQALDKTRPYLQSHGGNVELVGVDDAGVVRLRMQGSCHGCPSSSMTLKLAIEQAIQEAAPDVTAIVVEGEPHAAPASPPGAGLVALEPVRRSPSPDGDGVWQDLPALDDVNGAPRVREVGGREVLFCRAEGALYAYGARCPACNAELALGELSDHLLVCAGCGRGYDVIHAGRAADQSGLHLDPFPILTRDGRLQLALPPLPVAAIPG